MVGPIASHSSELILTELLVNCLYTCTCITKNVITQNLNGQFSEKKKLSLADILFKRSPRGTKRQLPAVPKSAGGPQLERIQGVGYRYVSRRLPEPRLDNPMDSPKIRNAVYCAIILDEFLKELAALSQEHSVLIEEGFIECS